jgi:hypothetical protein
MSRARALLLAFVGLAFPVGLALAVYATSASSLAAVPTVISAPEQVARSQVTRSAPTEAETTTRPTTSTSGTMTEREDRDDDLPGKCDDPDHELDPDCDPRASDDDSSGPGSGSDDSSGPGSGSDDDSSGPGSGDDD